MSKVIIYQRPAQTLESGYVDAGGVSIIRATEGHAIEECIAHVPEGLAYQVVEESVLPERDEFRNAWTVSGKKVKVDIGLAKEVRKEHLRAQREPLMAAQDIAFQRALEQAAPTDKIVAEKQRLRDITAQVDKAKTLEEIKAVAL